MSGVNMIARCAHVERIDKTVAFAEESIEYEIAHQGSFDEVR